MAALFGQRSPEPKKQAVKNAICGLITRPVCEGEGLEAFREFLGCLFGFRGNFTGRLVAVKKKFEIFSGIPERRRIADGSR